MKNLLALALFILLPFTLLAQLVELSGVVVDSTNQKPLTGANIAVLDKTDAKLITGTITDNEGKFVCRVAEGNYRLKLSFVGYQTKEIEVAITNRNRKLGVIMLKEGATLEEVNVVEKLPLAIQKGDTTEYNAGAYKTAPDANAENLIEKMPGVTIENGKVKAQGDEVKKVLVDGKPFFGDDANAALKNLPADVIDKIQVFDQLSEQSQFTGFDDGNSQKTVNIVTKSRFRNGTFGRVNAGYGYEDKYKASLSINKFKEARRITLVGLTNNINQQNFSTEDLAGVMSGGGGGGRGGRGGGGFGGGEARNFMVNQQGGMTTTNAVGLNYSDKWGEKIELSGSYFFNRSDNSATNSLFRQYISTRDSGQTYQESESSSSINYNHRFNLRVEVKVNENNSILYRPRLSFQGNQGNSAMFGETETGEILLNNTTSKFKSDLTAWSLSNSILWRHKFAKTGRTISLNFDQEMRPTQAESSMYAENNYFTQNRLDTLDQLSELDKSENQYSGNVSYTEPIGKVMQLQLNYRSSLNLNNSDKETFNYSDITNGYNDLDTILSNKFRSRYLSHSGSAGLRYNKEKLNASVRASYEWSELNSRSLYEDGYNGTHSFTSLLFNSEIRYKITDNINLNASYRTNTSSPSIDKLQDVLDNSNPLQLSIGNPTLDQSYRHNLFVRYSASNKEKSTSFFFMLGGSFTNDYIGNQTITAYRDTVVFNNIPLTKGTRITRPVNLDGQFTTTSYLTYAIPITKIKSNFNFNISANYNRTPGLINNETNYSHSPSFGGGVGLSSNISEKLDFMVSFNSRLSYAINTLQPQNDSKYMNYNSRFRFFWNFVGDMLFRTELSYQLNTGLSDQYNNEYTLCNISLGTRLFANNQGELSLAVYDLFNQNTSINRSVRESYIEDSTTDVLQRYFMLTFSYNIKKM